MHTGALTFVAAATAAAVMRTCPATAVGVLPSDAATAGLIVTKDTFVSIAEVGFSMLGGSILNLLNFEVVRRMALFVGLCPGAHTMQDIMSIQ